MLQDYAAFVTLRPWMVLAASLVLAVALSLGLGSLTFRSDSRVFFADDNPELMALDAFETTYGRDDTLLFVVQSREGDLFTPERLAAVNALTEAAWNMPDVKRVDSVTNFQRVRAVGDDIEIDHLARAGDELTTSDALRLKQDAANEPLLINRLLSKDAKLGLVAVNFRFEQATASDQAGAAIGEGQRLAEDFRKAHPDLQVGLSESVALDHAFVEASTFDSSVLLPLMVVVLLVIIMLLLRSPAASIATLCVISLGTMSALGAAAFLGVPLSSPSVIAPNIILTIACCDCIHLCAGMMRLRAQGLAKREAICEVLVECWWPVTLTTITTSIGFFFLAFSAVPPFAHLGIIVALGSVLCWMLTVSFLPALLCLLPWSASTRSLPAENVSMRIAGFVLRQPRRVLTGVFLVTGVLTALAFTNQLDDRYVRYFGHGYAFRQATDQLNDKLGGFYTIEYSLDPTEADGIARANYLEQVDRLAIWLRQQPGVTHVHGLPDVLKTVNRAMNGGNAEQFRLAGNRDLTAQHLALYEMSLPFGTDLKNQITADKRASRLTVNLNDVSTAYMAELEERTAQWANRNTPLIAPSVKGTGTSLLFAHIGNRNIQEMLTGIATGVLAVWVIFLIAFRSFFLSLVGTIANFVPALITLGVWAIVNGEVGMAVATVASVTFGVVVDDTIHMITTYAGLRRREGLTPEMAIRGAFEIVGPGMIAMTLALSAGFACLAFSGFQINSWMGMMAAATILAAVAFDVLFIPSVLLLFDRSKAATKRRIRQENTTLAPA